uniref:NADH dehydrogenase subunit 2 n=1 Tax=Ophraella communa TaxID=38162 RepID=UPI000EF342FC|nr:NADH dehydrogenase subunit 2 [Ophraella communa]AST14952.1 NADH dehydrogenase subunit 2 [Ophraella communa]
MLSFYKILFFNSMIVGTLIAVSSYSWLSMWIGLEINLLSIIPLMKSNKNIFPSEAALKYFITQALASTIILFTVILSLMKLDFIQQWNYWTMMMMNSGLLTKLGAAPFHAWFPEVMEGLNWMNSLIILTWQKIAPMVLVMYNLNSFWFLSWIIIFSSLVGGILGLNQTSLRKIMAYSSINHIGWMLASMIYLKLIWFLYFSIYSFISINIIFVFKYLKIYKISQLFCSLNSNKLMKMFFIMNFFSLGGLPPFLGFLPKWIVINSLVEGKMFTLSLILIISTLVTLYFYLRITFSSIVILSSEIFSQKIKMSNFWMMTLFTFSLVSLFLCTSILSIY